MKTLLLVGWAILFWYLPLATIAAVSLSFSTSLIILGCVFAIYFLCASGQIDTMDADSSLATARSLWHRGTFIAEFEYFDTFEFFYAQARPGKWNDKWVSKLGITSALLYVPAIAVGTFVARVFSVENEQGEKTVASFANTWVMALVVALLHAALTVLTSPFLSVALTMTAAFGTYLFGYSKTAQREPLQALALTALAALALSTSSEQMLFAGLWFSVGILTKLALGFSLLPLAFLFPSFEFLAAMSLGPLLWMLFAKYYWGSVWSTGYSRSVVLGKVKAWRTPFWYGVYRQLVSIQTGFIWYNPVVLALPFAVAGMQWTRFSIAIAASVLIRVMLYARWWNSTGDCALGPRYLVAITPLLFLVGAPGASLLSPIWFFLVGFSGVWQVLMVSVKAQQYWTLRHLSHGKIHLPQWWVNVILFRRKWMKAEEVYPLSLFGVESTEQISLTGARSLQGFNFWWLHLRRR